MNPEDSSLQRWFLFRRLLGVLVVVYCVLLAFDFSILVSSSGLWPCDLTGPLHPLWNSIDPICALGGNYTWVIERVVFALLLIAGIACASGRGSPFVSATAWLCLLSLHHRAPMILDGADGLLRLLLLVMILVPSKSASKQITTIRLAVLTALHRVVLALMYLIAGAAKYGTAWRDGTACELVSRDPEFAFSWFPAVLAIFPEWLTRVSCITIPWVEVVGGVAMLASLVTNVPLRAVVVILAALHLSFFAFLRLELFPLVCLIGLVPLWSSPQPASIALLWKESRSALAAVILCGGLLLCGAVQIDVPLAGNYRSPTIVRVLGAAGLIQTWRLFAPAPRTTFCYREMLVNEYVNGRTIQTLYVSSGRSEDLFQERRSRLRWRHFLTLFTPRGMAPFRKPISKDICKTPTEDQWVEGTLVCQDAATEEVTRAWLWSVSCDLRKP